MLEVILGHSERIFPNDMVLLGNCWESPVTAKRNGKTEVVPLQ